MVVDAMLRCLDVLPLPLLPMLLVFLLVIDNGNGKKMKSCFSRKIPQFCRY